MMDPKTAPTYESTTGVKNSLKPIRKPVGFVAPQPKKQTANGAGPAVLPDINKYPRNTRPIIIYECEADPNCKKVREACTMLDLTVEYRPCPGRAGHSDNLATVTLGKRDIPFMIDDGGKMVKPRITGAAGIVKYLFDAYGPGEEFAPKNLLGGSSTGTGGGKGSKIRANVRPDITKIKPIVLYGWEGAQYVKQVREVMTELGIAHVMVNCGKGSNNR
jgi:hypothetical protein